jgi:hypothetical protein
MFRINDLCATLTPEGVLPFLLSSSQFKLKTKLESTLLFITLVYLKMYYKTSDQEDNQFQPISSNILMNILTTKAYKKIILELESLGIIESNRGYNKALNSIGYRLTEKYASQNAIARTIRTKTVQIKFYRLQKYYLNNLVLNFPYLKQQIENFKYIYIDKQSADLWIEKNILDNEERKRYYKLSVDKIYYNYSNLLVVSNTNDRAFSAFTSLPKDLRKFLYVINENTGEMIFEKIEIDGKNTQPLLISAKMLNDDNICDTDFKELTLNGTLYDKMAEELNESRTWIKDRMMDTLLFTKNNSRFSLFIKEPNAENAAKQKFASYFTNRFAVADKWLFEKKKEYEELKIGKNKRNSGGSKLAIEIQKMESNLWIHNFLKQIPNGIIYFTIHDSIMLFRPDNETINYLQTKLKMLAKELYNIDNMPLSVKKIS